MRTQRVSCSQRARLSGNSRCNQMQKLFSAFCGAQNSLLTPISLNVKSKKGKQNMYVVAWVKNWKDWVKGSNRHILTKMYAHSYYRCTLYSLWHRCSLIFCPSKPIHCNRKTEFIKIHFRILSLHFNPLQHQWKYVLALCETIAYLRSELMYDIGIRLKELYHANIVLSIMYIIPHRHFSIIRLYYAQKNQWFWVLNKPKWVLVLIRSIFSTNFNFQKCQFWCCYQRKCFCSFV